MMTKEKKKCCYKQHHKMWDYLQNNPMEGKGNYMQKFPKEGAQKAPYHCFLCQVHLRGHCKKCPIELNGWGCRSFNSLYRKWRGAKKDSPERVVFATQIRDCVTPFLNDYEKK